MKFEYQILWKEALVAPYNPPYPSIDKTEFVARSIDRLNPIKLKVPTTWFSRYIMGMAAYQKEERTTSVRQP